MSLGYSQKRTISRTGHYARIIASYIPLAMLFVPSIKGKSHSEDELTVLQQTVMELFTKKGFACGINKIFI